MLRYRHEPTLREVQAEAERLLPILRDMLPSSYHVDKVTVVRRIVDAPEEYANIIFDENAGGAGRMAEMVVSTFELHRNQDWKRMLFVRMGHEQSHCRTIDAEVALKLDMIREGYLRAEDDYNKFLDDFMEAASEAIGKVLHWFATNYEI